VRGQTLRLGVAGWGVASRYLSEIPAGGSHLERYARVFSAVEINTSFYRHHQLDTYARWAHSVGADFRFSVKTPKALTHEGALIHKKNAVLDRFFLEVAGLGRKLRVILVQLPPSLEFAPNDARKFFVRLRKGLASSVAIVCEPRHISWNSAAADGLLKDLGVSRAAVDPARWGEDAVPGGDRRLAYFRMHGSPRIYYSDYESQQLDELSAQLQSAIRTSDEAWCIFDNTALGHAIGNALSVQRVLTDGLVLPAVAQRTAARVS
jgi:uncharacterized protein YecE (DUF72 family)